MWLVNPRILCKDHLLGEHLECHMFLGTLKKSKKVNGYLKNNLLEPDSLKSRHDELADEMIKRGYYHKTPISICEFENLVNTLNDEFRAVKINKQDSFNELISRCSNCKKRYEEIK
jgi:glutaredoxin 2